MVSRREKLFLNVLCRISYAEFFFFFFLMQTAVYNYLMIENLLAMWETQVRSPSWEDSLAKGVANHFSILAWKIPQRSLLNYSTWVAESDTNE